MYFVFFALALVTSCAEPQELEHGAGCDGECDAGSLLQRKLPRQQTVTAGARAATNSNKSSFRNLLVFFDGTLLDVNHTCDFVEGRYCDSNIVDMWRQTTGVDDNQLTFYMNGAGIDNIGPVGDAATGQSANYRAKIAYRWLVSVYQPGDKIFAFGHSRGCISARILQGMIHRVGIAKKGDEDEALAASYKDSKTAKFKESGKAWPDSYMVHFLGLFESVLRTVSSALDIKSWHLTISPAVKTFAHAMALGEIRRIYEVNELIVPSTTKATQVWFAGQHGDLGGNIESNGIADISKAWMVDHAIASGMMMRKGWEANLIIDAQGETHTDREVHGADSTGWFFRNPGYCRQEAGFGDTPIKVHKSVRDRMGTFGGLNGLVPGWNPPQWCCSNFTWVNNIEWVSNSAYDAVAQSPPSSKPQWVRVVLGKLENAKTRRSTPKWYARVQQWHSSKALAELTNYKWGDRTYSSSKHYPSNAGEPTNTFCPSDPTSGSCDFSSAILALMPADASSVDEFLIEVWEENVKDDLVGRFVLRYDDPSAVEMLPRDIDGPDGNAVFWAKLDIYRDDNSVKAVLGNTEKPAQCTWLLDTMLHKTEYHMCNRLFTSVNKKRTCESYIKDLTCNEC